MARHIIDSAKVFVVVRHSWSGNEQAGTQGDPIDVPGDMAVLGVYASQSAARASLRNLRSRSNVAIVERKVA